MAVPEKGGLGRGDRLHDGSVQRRPLRPAEFLGELLEGAAAGGPRHRRESVPNQIGFVFADHQAAELVDEPAQLVEDRR